MRSLSLASLAVAVTVVGLLSVDNVGAQTLPTPVKDLHEFKRDYFTDRPITYSPDDPCYRGKVFRLHTKHYGRFYNCDLEEQKRYSPYIYWSMHCEPDFVPHKPCLQKIREELDTVRQRIADGAGACCQSNCSGSCGDNQCAAYRERCVRSGMLKSAAHRGISTSKHIVSSVASTTRGIVSHVGTCAGSSCNSGACSSDCGSSACASGHCTTRSCGLNLRGRSSCPTGNCAPERGINCGCNAPCGCSNNSFETEGPSGLMTAPSYPSYSLNQGAADQQALAFVAGAKVAANQRELAIENDVAVRGRQVRERANGFRKPLSVPTMSSSAGSAPDYSVLKTTPITDRLANSYDSLTKRQCNCDKCIAERVAAPSQTTTAKKQTESKERSANNSLIERIRGLSRL